MNARSSTRYPQRLGIVYFPRLVGRFAKGPIDWKSPPEVQAVVKSLRTELVAR